MPLRSSDDPKSSGHLSLTPVSLVSALLLPPSVPLQLPPFRFICFAVGPNRRISSTVMWSRCGQVEGFPRLGRRGRGRGGRSRRTPLRGRCSSGLSWKRGRVTSRKRATRWRWGVFFTVLLLVRSSAEIFTAPFVRSAKYTVPDKRVQTLLLCTWYQVCLFFLTVFDASRRGKKY